MFAYIACEVFKRILQNSKIIIELPYRYTVDIGCFSQDKYVHLQSFIIAVHSFRSEEHRLELFIRSFIVSGTMHHHGLLDLDLKMKPLGLGTKL